MGQGATLLDVLVALLQSIVVLLLASAVYVALVVRKPGDASLRGEPDAAATQSGPRSLSAPRADSPGS